MNIGIIGQGFVGNAVYQKFKNYYDVLTYDLDESKCNSNVEEIIRNVKIYFYVYQHQWIGMGVGRCEHLLAGIDLTRNLETERKLL